MIIGESGVGKSTWIHFINYMQSMSKEENNRYLLFDEEKIQEEYEKEYGKKPSGSSLTDKLEIYDIKGSKLYRNQIRLIDTPGFEDTIDESYVEIIIDDIKNYLTVQIWITFMQFVLFLKEMK